MAGAAIAAGVLVWALSLRDTVERPFSEVERYSATVGDFLLRDPGEFEQFVYLGWLLPLLAVVGLVCLCFRNTISSGRRLALVLGLGALVPCLLALGSNLPGYGFLWRNTPLHSTRVPERLRRSRVSASVRWRRSRWLVFQKHKLVGARA